MIYTVTLNPSIDYSMYPNEFYAGEINRSMRENYTCGGKGINVSRMLANLGEESVALGFLGGYAGEEIERLVRRCGIKSDFCKISDCSRINVKIISANESAVNAKGPFIRLEEEKALLDKLAAVSSSDTIIISGSAPESESGALLENVLNAAAGSRLVVDMEGKALDMACDRKPYLIKPNSEELSGLFDKEKMNDEEMLSAVKKLQSRGVGNVLVSLGERGALLASEDGRLYKIRAPKVCVKNTVGAGDSFLAGFLAGEERGVEFALALGAAAGSATAECEEIAEYEDVMNVFSMM